MESTTTGVIPTIVSAEEAADALGIGVLDLHRNIRAGVAASLTDLASFVLRDAVSDLEAFDEQVEGARRLFAAAVACDKAWRKGLVDDGS